MKKRYDRDAAAFSLVEFIIYFAILGAVGILLVNLLYATTQSKAGVDARTEVQQNIRYNITRMTQAIHNATGINGTPGADLSLVMSTGAVNPTVFNLSGGYLRITEGVSSAQNLTSDKVNVTGLTFTRVANPSPAVPTVQINITIAYRDNGNPQLVFSQNFITTVSLKQ